MRIAQALNELGVQDTDNPELALYRMRTEGLLRKYLRMSVELGHLPSLLGREFFRTQVTCYGTNTFEDAVIFVHDVDRCLEKMHKRYQEVVARLFFQQYTNEETAKLMNCDHRTLVRWRVDALDLLTSMFLEKELLKKMPDVIYEALQEDPEDLEEVDADGDECPLPPKKGPKGDKTIHAVAVSA